jgi:hypothetical protein
MSINIPPAVNYPSPLIQLPTRWQNIPTEGPKMIPLEVDWVTMGGTGHCVSVNVGNNATLNFSQIVALDVDNSQCGSDVAFVFPDGPTQLVVPAYEGGVFPVFTGSTSFYVVALSEEPSDVTKFILLNQMPPVLVIPKGQFQDIAAFAGIVATGPSTTPIIPAGVSGTLEQISLVIVFNSTAASNVSGNLSDGNGVVIATFGAAAATGQLNFQALNLDNISVRFGNGLNLVYTATSYPTGGELVVNVYYRTP